MSALANAEVASVRKGVPRLDIRTPVRLGLLVILAFLPFPFRIGSVGDWVVGAAQVAAKSLF